MTITSNRISSKLLLLVLSIVLSTTALAQTDERKGLRAEICNAAEDELVKSNVPGAAIALIKERKVAWIDGVGFADKANMVPVTKDTVFNVGSISKTVSAWGFMQLVDHGIVNLDQPIERYLTRWSLPQSKFSSNEVTLRRILSHSAGLSLSGYPGTNNAEDLPSIEQSLSGINSSGESVKIVIEPGSKYQYSGGGYTVAQLMLEEQTQEGFSKYMTDNVLKPLGMDSSHFGWTSSPNAATPYDTDGLPIEPVRFTELAAAGLETTCHDLAQFAAASLEVNGEPLNQVLQSKTLMLMQQKESPGESSRSAGLGYQQMRFGPFNVVGHLGSNSGWEAAVLLYPKSGDGLVILTNGSNGSKIARRVFGIWAKTLPR